MDYALIKVITLCNLQLFTALLFLHYVMISKKDPFFIFIYFLFSFFFFFGECLKKSFIFKFSK